MRTVYNITKKLSGKYTSQATPVKDKDGNILRTEQEQTTRWVKHFCEVLSFPEPDDPANPPLAEDAHNIDTSPPTHEEVKCAIQAMKGGKAAGIDAIHAKMLKADLTTSTKVLTELFRNIWDKETIPDDWDKGLIVKLPKKGNLQNGDNWRGIKLQSIPSKVFCRILLGRIDSGFRRERGSTDQIFALKNIIVQCVEWNAPLHINVIDFRKAFDSLHCGTLWKIVRACGISH